MNKLILILSFLALCACSSDGAHQPLPDPNAGNGTGTEDGAGTGTDGGTDGGTDTMEMISYQKEILPIIENRCSLCHNENSGLPNWEDYNTALDNKEKIYDRVVVRKNMPLSNQTNMTQEERDIFMAWIDEGALP